MDNKLTKYIAENNKKRNTKLKYDFMPSLLEIIERPAHRAGTVIILTIAVLLVAVVVWACLAKLDVVVTGTGNIVPEGKLVELQPLIGGKVEQINVKVGDYVNTGDIIVSLENSTADLELEQINRNMEWCRIRTEITKERLKNDEYDVPVESYDEQYYNGLQQIVLEIDMYKDQKRQREQNLAEAKADLEAARTEGNESVITTLETRVQSYEDSISSAEKSQKSQMYSQLFSLENEMRSYETQLSQYEIKAETYLIKAPVNGYVNVMSVVSPGQTVSAGTAVCSIVPSDRELQFECYVQDRDRSDIEVGMDVAVKLSAFSFSDYGAIPGKVTYISPSSFVHEKYGNVYVVDIELDREHMNQNIALTSGLSGNVEIITGKRTVMEYFIEPITRGLDQSLKEN